MEHKSKLAFKVAPKMMNMIQILSPHFEPEKKEALLSNHKTQLIIAAVLSFLIAMGTYSWMEIEQSTMTRLKITINAGLSTFGYNRIWFAVAHFFSETPVILE